MANVNIKPLGDRVLVKPLEEKEITKGGIIIPDAAKKNHRKQKSSLLAQANAMMTANSSLSPSKSVTKSSYPNTAEPKSRSKASPSPSCAKTTSSASSAKKLKT